MEVWDLTVRELLSRIRAREISAQEVLDLYLERIAELDQALGAFLEVLEPEARLQAARVDAMIMRGEDPGLLAGIPVALKDNLCMKGAKCTCSSRILADWVAPYDATCVRRLREQGAVIIGKTNMDEFAMGSSTENSAFGPTRNPWDLERVPGGSSGGSACAVAAGLAALALGSDTGGSIRQPASFCGIAGLKPTYGLVSRYGLVAFASSLDQVGPLGQSVWDCALALEVIAGHDPLDSTSSLRPPVRYSQSLQKTPRGLRAGVPAEFLSQGISPGVRRAFEQALEVMTDLGISVEETSLPTTEYALDTYYIIAPSEASSNLARYDGVRYGFRHPAGNLDDMYAGTRGAGFGPEVRRRIMLGTFALSAGYYDAYYLRAAKIRTLIRRDFQKAFEKYDIILTPTTPTVAFKLGERTGDPLSMYAADVLTIPVNLAGLPALSIPCGFAAPEETPAPSLPGSSGSASSGPESLITRELPCGLQIIGRPFDEETVLAVGWAFETALGEELRHRLRAMRRELVATKECEPVD